MKTVLGLKCTGCGKEYEIKKADRSFICDHCLSPLSPFYDYQALKKFPLDLIIKRGPNSIWRYAPLLPVEEPRCGFNSGWTPLVRADNLAKVLGIKPGCLYIKNDSVNRETCSYKDRVTPVALSSAVEQGYKKVGCASTGNLAQAVAAYAAQLGLPAYIFIPSGIEKGKIISTQSYGAKVIEIKGTYDDVNMICGILSQEENNDIGFVNVNLRPWYAEGAKTMAFEIVEQLGWKTPDHIISPVAGATLLPRIWKGLKEFELLGLIDTALPKLWAAQATGCSPVINTLDSGSKTIRAVKPNTIAHSIAIGNPADGMSAVRNIKESGGGGQSATDAEIVEAIKLLARTQGIFTEPAGGTTLAVYKKLIEQGKISTDEVSVVCITGSGLKTPEAISETLENPLVITETLFNGVRQFKKLLKKR